MSLAAAYELFLKRLYRNPPIFHGFVRQALRETLSAREVVFEGLRWEAHPGDNTTERELWLGELGEHEDIRYLRDYCRGRRIVFADVGANIGLYSLLVSAVADPASVIVSFEPNRKVSQRLRRNIDLNGLSNIEIREVALSSEPGRALFHAPARYDLGQAGLRKGNAEQGAFEVDVSTLLAELSRIGEPRFDILKVDVEGHEDEVLSSFLAGARESQLPTLIVFESIRVTDETPFLRRARDLGYRVARQSELNTVLALGDL